MSRSTIQEQRVQQLAGTPSSSSALWLHLLSTLVLQSQLAKKKLQVNCEQPNSSLYTFTGNLFDGKKTLSLSPNQVPLPFVD